VFSILLRINKEKSKLEQGLFYFKAQPATSAKINKGVPSHSTDCATVGQARQATRKLAR